jgi:hypothetical protein
VYFDPGLFFWKICWENSNIIKTRKEKRIFHV